MVHQSTLSHCVPSDQLIPSPTRLPPPGPSILRNPTISPDPPAPSSPSLSDVDHRGSPEHSTSLLATLSATLRRVIATTPERRRRRQQTPDGELWLAGPKPVDGPPSSITSCPESHDGLVGEGKRQESATPVPAMAGGRGPPAPAPSAIRFAPLPLLTHPRPCGLGVATRAALLSPTSPTHAHGLSPPSLSSSSSSSNTSGTCESFESSSSSGSESHSDQSADNDDDDDDGTRDRCQSNGLYHSDHVDQVVDDQNQNLNHH